MENHSETSPVTPEEIIDLILEEMRAEVAPSKYSILVRSVYHVYLHIDELERLRPVLTRIREEAIRALNDELSRLNSAQGKMKIAFLQDTRKRKRHEAMGEWVIEFDENVDEDAEENPVIIHSAFAIPKGLDDRAGTLTERVTKRRADGQTTTTHGAADTETRRSAGTVYAYIEYEDDNGSQTYQMTKEQIKIGRGAADRWVDLKLSTKKDVSREHLQLRRDGHSGQFFIKDLSTLGTTVNGKRIRASIVRVNGEDVDKNIEAPLPEKARIGLAGVLFLNFKAVRQK